MSLVQFRSPGACKLVTKTTRDRDGQVFFATALGQPDELMTESSFFAFLVSSTGATLEAASDGLRISANALGSGLTGGGGAKITLSADNVALQASANTDELLFFDSLKRLRKTTRQDLIAAASGSTDLGIIAKSTTVTITSSSGADADMPAATSVTAGVMLPTDRTWIDAWKAQDPNVLYGATADGVQGKLARSDLPVAAPATGTVIVAYDAAGALNGIAWANVAANLSATYGADSVTVVSSSGNDAVLAAATDATAGVMSAADKALLDSLSANSTNLGTSRTATTVTVTNSTGTDAVLPAATTVDAGIMTATDKTTLEAVFARRVDLASDQGANTDSITITSSQGDGVLLMGAGDSWAGLMTAGDKVFVEALKSAPQNALLGTPAGAGQPEYIQSGDIQLRSPTSATTVLGWEANGAFGRYAFGASETIPMINSLSAGDVGKPICAATGGVHDDTDTVNFVTGILAEVVDATQVRLISPGGTVVIPTSLLEAGYDLATDGPWMAWDLSAGTYVSVRPTDSDPDLPELLEVVDVSGGSATCIVHDHGPVSGGGTVGGGGGTPPAGEEEILVSVGVPPNPPAAGYKLAIDTSALDLYIPNGSIWTLLEKGISLPAEGVTNPDVQSAGTVVIAYSTPGIEISDFRNGRSGQHLRVLFGNDNAKVLNLPGTIKLEAATDFTPGALGGALCLTNFGGVWYETSRTIY